MRSSVGLFNHLGRCFDAVRKKPSQSMFFQSCSYSPNAVTSVPSFPNLTALFADTSCVPKTYMRELIRFRKQVLDCESTNTEGVRLTTTLPLTRCVGRRSVHVFPSSLWLLLLVIVFFFFGSRRIPAPHKPVS